MDNTDLNGCDRQYTYISSMYIFVDLSSETLGILSDTLGSNPAFSRGRQLVSFRFENRLHVPEHRN